MAFTGCLKNVTFEYLKDGLIKLVDLLAYHSVLSSPILRSYNYYNQRYDILKLDHLIRTILKMAQKQLFCKLSF